MRPHPDIKVLPWQNLNGRMVTIVLILLTNNCIAKDDGDVLPTPAPEEVMILKGHGNDVRSVRFHPDGSVLYSGGWDAQVIKWNFTGISQMRKKPNISAYWEIGREKVSDHVVALDFDRTGNYFAASGVVRWGNGFSSSLKLFTPYRQKPFRFGSSAAWSYSCVSIHPRGQFVAMGGLNNQLRVVSLLPTAGKKGNIVPNLVSKEASDVPREVWRVAFHPELSVIAAGGKGGWINLYDIEIDGVERNQTIEVPQHGQTGGVNGLSFSGDGKFLISAAGDKQVQVLALESGESRRWQHGDSIPKWLDVHPCYPWMIVAYSDGVARIINYLDGKLVATLEGHTKALLAAAFHPDGTWAATGGKDHTVRVWNLHIPRPKRRRP